MTPIIKRLTIEDYDEIIRIWSDAGLSTRPCGRESKEVFAQELADPNCAVFGLHEEGRMLAVGIANFDGRRGWINRVAVDPDHRGRGLGGQMIRECERFLKDKGALVMAALIEDDNTPSMTCFEKEGYSCLPDIKYFSKYEFPEA
jgi:GNAT superfamily N-acetyltransferase